jgi:hypothetical protein
MSKRLRNVAATATGIGALMFAPGAAQANHPVLVEGNCGAPDAVLAGACGDYDGDGRVGTAEDTDAVDRVFGTINGALGNTDLGSDALNASSANLNGRVLVVASGDFPEVVRIAPGGRNQTVGNVTLEGAPGVDANIDAVVQGEAGNVERQAQPGIEVAMPSDRRVTIRNVVSRNWTDGIRISGVSRVTLDRVRVENNTEYGIRAIEGSRMTVRGSDVQASGFRANPMAASNAPMPGTGITIEGSAKAGIFGGTVSENFADGIENETVGATGTVRERRKAARRLIVDDVRLFGNGDRDVEGPATLRD